MYSFFFTRLIVLLLILIYLVMGLQLFSTRDDLINLVLNAALPILVGLLFLTYVNLDRQKEELSKCEVIGRQDGEARVPPVEGHPGNKRVKVS